MNKQQMKLWQTLSKSLMEILKNLANHNTRLLLIEEHIIKSKCCNCDQKCGGE